VPETSTLRRDFAARKFDEFTDGGATDLPDYFTSLVFAYASKISNSTSEYGSQAKDKNCAEAEDSAPYIFRSYDHWGSIPPVINERNPGVAASIPIWEVARAVSGNICDS
jgi:hypothetical protein